MDLEDIRRQLGLDPLAKPLADLNRILAAFAALEGFRSIR
jgi:hypothetical protein